METWVTLTISVLVVCAFYGMRRRRVRERRHIDEIKALYKSTLSTLALAIDAKDRTTHGHIVRVETYARAIAGELSLPEAEVDAVAAAALLHDIGKLAVPEYILRKRGPLTPEEMAKMRRHPELGAEIISNIRFAYPVADAVRYHHERYDGTGYPQGLVGRDIPLAARILAVADVFDAYTSERHHASAQPYEAAIQLLDAESGRQFDPEIVSAWKNIYSDVVKQVVRRQQADTEIPAAYRGIQQATSEVIFLDALSDRIRAASSVSEIAREVRCVIESMVDGVWASVWNSDGKDILAAEEMENVPSLLALTRLTDWVAAHRSPLVNAHLGGSDNWVVAVVPVDHHGAVVAVIVLARRAAPFTDDEIRMLTAVADCTAGSVNAAMLLEVARLEAVQDGLTGLSNRRAFESPESGARDCPSIVMIDVNAFKAVNDNFGHEAGDHVLTLIAGHLRAAFEDARMLCRLGGDEFVVATAAGRDRVEKEIRRFQTAVLEDPELSAYLPFGFGLSCGSAHLPEDGMTVSELMRTADRRMYKEKKRSLVCA